MVDDNIQHSCPLCGRKKDEDEAFCSNCKEIADTAYPEGLLSERNITNNPAEELNIEKGQIDKNIFTKDENEEEEINPETNVKPTKSNKGTLIFLFVGLILLIIIGGVSSYLRIQNKDTEEVELNYWQQSMEENTALSYSKYLAHYPEGKYSEQAYTNIFTIKEEERKEWDELRKSKNTGALSSFLKENPNSPYEREIRYSIDSLTWQKATELNTKEAYLAYIENAKNGHYLGENINLAQEKFDYLDQLKPVEGDELKELKLNLNNFFKSLSSTNSKDIQKLCDTVLIKFCEFENIESKLIADSIKTNLRKNKIRTISYKLIEDSLNIIKDNKGIYFSKTPIEATTTFTNKKQKKKIEKYNLTIQLNEKKRILSIERDKKD